MFDWRKATERAAEKERRAKARARKTEEDSRNVERFLKTFTTESIVSAEQKKALKKVGWIEWSGGMWCLTDTGKAAAEERGYL